MTLHFDTLFINANLATMNPQIVAPYGTITDAALGVKDGRIAWLGRRADIPNYEAGKIYDCENAWLTPGLVDCHTHLVFGGNRASEFELRLQGASYAKIAKSGGGIVSTVNATRKTSKDDLYRQAELRVCAMGKKGVTTIEIKSGYGLDIETEIKMLEVAQMLAAKNNMRIQKTFLGAHALPLEYKDRPDAYIDLVCHEILPEIARRKLADAVDGFCENIAFSVAQIRRVFEAAKKHGLAIKLHAEQLSNQGGAKLAAEFGALSADHLEYIDEAGVMAMAKAGTIAVLLPGAFYYLKETQKPPIDLFEKHGVPMALATDFNPGSSPISSPRLIMNMACTLFGLTPEQALTAITLNGARALGLDGETGSLAAGKSADIAIWKIQHPAELCYWVGDDDSHARVYQGKFMKNMDSKDG